MPRTQSRKRGDSLTALEPNAVSGLRERLLALIGYDEAKQAQLLKAGIDKLSEQLSATRVQRLVVRTSRETEEVVAFNDAALDIQHRAAVALIDVTGGHAAKQAQASQAPTAIQVNVNLAPMPGASLPKTITVEAKSLP